MKIGIISDIRSDAIALRKALDLLRAEGVDQIVCAGDLVNKGGDSEGVVRLIQSEAITISTPTPTAPCWSARTNATASRRAIPST